MKNLFLLLISIYTIETIANMASPIRPGTKSSTAYTTRNIDIEKESISITTDENFELATFDINYQIQCDSAGNQIPLLFYAMDFNKAYFKIYVDNIEIDSSKIQTSISRRKLSAPIQIVNLSTVKKQATSINDDEIEISFEQNHFQRFKKDDLIYFEVDLTTGKHDIRILYSSKCWIDKSDWIKQKSFRYSLSPARHWKSFGKMEITIDANATKKIMTTNLGKPNIEDGKYKATWHFDSIPNDFILINYKPKPSIIAETLIKLHPINIAILAFLLMSFFHLKTIYNKHKNKEIPSKLIIYSISFLIPIITILTFIFSFPLIDMVIGKDASEFHGYTFLSIIFYPIILIPYLIIVYITDRYLRSQKF